jgi:hypothetical protein
LNRPRLTVRSVRLNNGVNVVRRLRSILSILVLVLPASCASTPDLAPTLSLGRPTAENGQILSPAAHRVSQVAQQSGDRNFLMLDKTHGRIIVFEGGKPTYSGAALTGESPADYLAPDATSLTFRESRGLRYKVTPAGRYTLSTGFDLAYGKTLDINEIHGKDWDIAIHKVWLGAPSEHREARLRSTRDEDKHITYGCIDVEEATMRQILDRLSDGHPMPFYILPRDESLIIKLFQPRESVRKTSSPAG